MISLQCTARSYANARCVMTLVARCVFVRLSLSPCLINANTHLHKTLAMLMTKYVSSCPPLLTVVVSLYSLSYLRELFILLVLRISAYWRPWLLRAYSITFLIEASFVAFLSSHPRPSTHLSRAGYRNATTTELLTNSGPYSSLSLK